MSFFYITNISLDILWGITWWIFKKTQNGVYTILYFNKEPLHKIKDCEHKILKELLEENIKQQEQITILNEKIEVINDYFKKNKKLIES